MTETHVTILQDENTPLVFHFNALAKVYFGALTSELDDLDLERYFFMISLIARNPKITQQTVADILDIDKANMTRMIEYLVDKGYVKRTVNPQDRREFLISATSKAEKIIPRINAAFKKINEVAVKGLSKAETAIFQNALLKAYQNLLAEPTDTYFLKYIRTKRSNK